MLNIPPGKKNHMLKNTYPINLDMFLSWNRKQNWHLIGDWNNHRWLLKRHCVFSLRDSIVRSLLWIIKNKLVMPVIIITLTWVCIENSGSKSLEIYKLNHVIDGSHKKYHLISSKLKKEAILYNTFNELFYIIHSLHVLIYIHFHCFWNLHMWWRIIWGNVRLFIIKLRNLTCIIRKKELFVVFFLCFFFLSFKFYLFLAELGLCCCAWVFSSCSERGLLFVAVCGLLIVMASLAAEHKL